MAFSLGKPISAITVDDLNALISEAWPESQYLEFKEDFSIHAQDEKQQLKDKPGIKPVSSWYTRGTVAEHGRDALLEELVGFAHADGGQLILGLEETKDEPRHALALRPLPNVAKLKLQLESYILDCIEPQLPFVGVELLVTEEDGAGLVLIEVEPSILGPHRVRKTRESTIRRGERCLPMAMREIHDMVLQNARRFDRVTAQIEDRAEDFRVRFAERLKQGGVRGGGPAVGFRVTLVPQQVLDAPRLESLIGLVPNKNCVKFLQDGKLHPVSDADLWITEQGVRRILGGVEQTSIWPGFDVRYVVMRNGMVEFCYINCSVSSEAPDNLRQPVQAHVQLFVATVACVLGIYDVLRIRAGSSSMPAQVSVEILTQGEVKLNLGRGQFQTIGSRPLDATGVFRPFVISTKSSFGDMLNELTGDLLNAGDLPAGALPTFIFV